jgi:hypothetical protein
LTLDPGSAVVYDEPLKLNTLRSDLIFYPAPFDKLVAAVCPDAKLRRLVRNMILRRDPGQAARHRSRVDGKGAQQASLARRPRRSRSTPER